MHSFVFHVLNIITLRFASQSQLSFYYAFFIKLLLYLLITNPMHDRYFKQLSWALNETFNMHEGFRLQQHRGLRDRKDSVRWKLFWMKKNRFSLIFSQTIKTTTTLFSVGCVRSTAAPRRTDEDPREKSSLLSCVSDLGFLSPRVQILKA